MIKNRNTDLTDVTDFTLVEIIFKSAFIYLRSFISVTMHTHKEKML